MSTPLPKAVLLVKTSVENALAHVNELWQPLILGGLSVLITNGLLAASMGLVLTGLVLGKGFLVLLGIILYIVCLVLMIGITLGFDLHITRRAARLLEGNKETIPAKESIKKIPSLLWITFLQGLFSAGPLAAFTIIYSLVSTAMVLGTRSEVTDDIQTALAAPYSIGMGLVGFVGLLICLVYTIYVTVRLQMSGTAFILDEKRGMEAIKASWAMTKERFWSILWRGLVFVVLAFVTMIVLAGILSILGSSAPAAFLRLIVMGGFQALLLVPSAIFLQIHLYKHLKETQK